MVYVDKSVAVKFSLPAHSLPAITVGMMTGVFPGFRRILAFNSLIQPLRIVRTLKVVGPVVGPPREYSGIGQTGLERRDSFRH